MLLGGDELSRTKRGNNNTYCQDNDFNWYNWDLGEREAAFLAFCKKLVAFRKAHPTFRRRSFLTGYAHPNICKDVSWWHPQGREMSPRDWRNGNLCALGMLLCGSAYYELDEHGEILGDDTFLLLFQGNEKGDFMMPPPPDIYLWERVLTTQVDPPQRKLKAKAWTKIGLEPYTVTVFKGSEE